MEPIPCNGCTICCKGDAIRILPQDDPTQYQTVPHERYPGHLMLAHKLNGDCIYLTEQGCGIHDAKPQMCKELDCRDLARKFTRKQALKLIGSLRVWNKGRQLICR